LTIALTTGTASAQTWRTYVNARFGTIADVPHDWSAGPEPANGDGRVFTSPDAMATIIVSGMLNTDAVEPAMQSREAPDDGETITYRHRDARAVVVSGTRGDIIFYRKSILSCGDQIWNDLSIEYPAARKKAYDSLVTHVAASLHFGRSAQIPTCK
jgi:hypothetical protein